MIKIEKLGIILSPTENDFENNGVFNPGVYQDGDTIHILYRAEQYGDHFTIGYAKISGLHKKVERWDHPLIIPEFDYEKEGVKDAKIVKIEDTYYITYVVYDGINTMAALATSKDLIHFEKHGIITPKINYQEYESLILNCGKKLNPKYHHYYQLYKEIGLKDDPSRFLRDKDVVLFPRKINGKFVLLHNLWPGIQIVYFDDWKDLTPSFWEEYFKNLINYIVLDPKNTCEVSHIGIGCPPIETECGWLLIYHSVEETAKGCTTHANAALLQIDKPETEIARLSIPLFSPTKQWEKKENGEGIVTPTGYAQFKKDLYIYYGAAKKHTAVAKVDINELLKELRKEP